MDFKNETFDVESSMHEDSDSDFMGSELEFQLYSQIHYHQEPVIPEVTPASPNRTGTNHFNQILEQKGGEDHLSKFLTQKSLGFYYEFDNQCSSSNERDVREQKFSHLVDDNSDSDISDLEKWEILDDVKDSNEENTIHIHVSEDAVTSDDSKACWKICKEDILAGLNKYRDTRRYFGDSNVRCKNCDLTGHIANECSKPKKVKPCFQCGIKGHMAKFCPKHIPVSRRHLSFSCNRCEQMGHIQSECPDLWRQYHKTTKAGSLVTSSLPLPMSKKKCCYNCGKRGHFGFDCKKSRSQTFAAVTQPTVFRYDHWIWIEHAKKSSGKSSKRPMVKTKDKTQINKNVQVTRTVHFNLAKEALTVKRNDGVNNKKRKKETKKNIKFKKEKDLGDYSGKKSKKPKKCLKRKAVNFKDENFKQNKKFKLNKKLGKKIKS
uniref:Zinc finger CCHC domain-containing protein 7 n=1 Tax=Ciona intestinalis TaxID=7719 RepID=Q1RPW4_CIOIN|nr:zinc finger protein [Ciona intestinalis]BAE93321.1 zinc finger protein [Ciona intestinalis]|eukprot:NP_001071924.1 zinc finger protein [Ciona intestinalis]